MTGGRKTRMQADWFRARRPGELRPDAGPRLRSGADAVGQRWIPTTAIPMATVRRASSRICLMASAAGTFVTA